MKTNPKNVLTYGTFDTFHYGHLELLRRAKELAQGGKLVVAISSDEFNAIKGKTSHFSYDERKKMLEAINYVDIIIPEDSWDQKEGDVKKYDIDIFVMGDDWRDKFDFLEPLCEVIYLPRTPSISSTAIKSIHRS